MAYSYRFAELRLNCVGRLLSPLSPPLLLSCLFKQAIYESRELMAPIIRMIGKLNPSTIIPEHAIRGLPCSYFILRVICSPD